jgi:hypothetical protein
MKIEGSASGSGSTPKCHGFATLVVGNLCTYISNSDVQDRVRWQERLCWAWAGWPSTGWGWAGSWALWTGRSPGHSMSRWGFLAGLWIRIYLMRIRIQYFSNCGSGSQCGSGSFYGLGLGRELGAVDRQVAWPQYVKVGVPCRLVDPHLFNADPDHRATIEPPLLISSDFLSTFIDPRSRTKD